MCNICCETWSAKVEKTECPYCHFEVCTKCLKTYMLGIAGDPVCMHPDCKKEWTVEHVFSILPKSFLKGDYKKHREVILYDREVAMLPATQPYVEMMIRKDRANTEMNRIDEAIKEMRARQTELRNEIAMLTYDIDNQHIGARNTQTRSLVNQHVGRCATAECKGFVSSSTYACGICEAAYCKKCFVVVPSASSAAAAASSAAAAVVEHVCKKDDIDTYEMIKKDSKPCPVCATIIYRTSGCSQMFCTQCNSAWDWKTLEITRDADKIHNPHYFAWRANNTTAAIGGAAAAAAAACGGNQVNYQNLEAVCKMLVLADRSYVFAMWGVINHFKRTELRHYMVLETPLFDRNKDIRIKFMQNEFDEKHLKMMIHKREKAMNKKREIHQILQAFCDVGIDIIGDLMIRVRAANGSRPRAECVVKMKEQFASAIEYSKEAIAKVAERYGCVVPNIDAIVVRFV